MGAKRKPESQPEPEESEPPAKSQKQDASAAAACTTPVNAVAAAEASPSPTGAPTRPTIVTGGDEASVLENMRGIVLFVLYNLRVELRTIPALAQQFPDVEPHLHAPLKIEGDPSRIAGDDLTSYKQSWDADLAHASLKGTSMFESAGNVLWCNPFPRMAPEEKSIAGFLPTWQQVVDGSLSDFSESGGSTKTIGKQRNSKVSRFVFRSVIPVIIDDIEMAKQSSFNLSLTVLTDFRPILSWWYAMFEALCADDIPRISSVWQAGLSATMHVRTNLSTAQQALLSISLSDKKKEDEGISDSFLSFTLKALVALKAASLAPNRGGEKDVNKTRFLNEQGCRWNGTLINNGMMTCVLMFDCPDAKFNDASVKILLGLERQYGKEMLTGSYSKLMRIGAVCSSHAERLDERPEILVQWTLECMRWQLQYEVWTPSDMKVEWLDKDKAGVLGILHAVAGRFAIHRMMVAWATDLAATSDDAKRVADTILELLSVFSDYQQYEKEFGPKQNEGGSEAETPKDGDADDRLDHLKKKYSSMTHVRIMEFCYDLLSGVLDPAIMEVMKVGGKDPIRIDGCDWLQAKNLAALREIYRLLNQHRQIVNLDSTKQDSMPALGAKTLKRYTSESGADELRAQELRKERSEAWRLAQTARKKLTHVMWAPIAKIQDLQQAYEKTPAFSNFTGKPGEQHRVIIFNAETFREAEDAPWSGPAEWSGHAEVIVKWMLTNKGSADVLFASDGRSRLVRKKLDALLDDARNLHEAWIVYTPVQRLGRRTAYAADNREQIAISMPLSRTQLTIQKRDTFNNAGESSTHELPIREWTLFLGEPSPYCRRRTRRRSWDTLRPRHLLPLRRRSSMRRSAIRCSGPSARLPPYGNSCCSTSMRHRSSTPRLGQVSAPERACRRASVTVAMQRTRNTARG